MSEQKNIGKYYDKIYFDTCRVIMTITVQGKHLIAIVNKDLLHILKYHTSTQMALLYLHVMISLGFITFFVNSQTLMACLVLTWPKSNFAFLKQYHKCEAKELRG